MSFEHCYGRCFETNIEKLYFYDNQWLEEPHEVIFPDFRNSKLVDCALRCVKNSNNGFVDLTELMVDYFHEHSPSDVKERLRNYFKSETIVRKVVITESDYNTNVIAVLYNGEVCYALRQYLETGKFNEILIEGVKYYKERDYCLADYNATLYPSHYPDPRAVYGGTPKHPLDDGKPMRDYDVEPKFVFPLNPHPGWGKF